MTPTSEVRRDQVAVLLVEDDPAMRALVRDYLRRDGFAVVDEASAEAAVAIAETRVFDAAVVDKELRGMSGLDFLSFFRLRCPGVPVIVVTAFGGSAVAQEALARGASRYMEKPFRFGELAAVLRNVTAVATAREASPGSP
jgi:DNA-binding response OmpR family regulator